MILDLVTKLVSEINITRKKVTFYPPGHSMIKEHIDKLISLFEELFSVRKEISLGIAKDKILFDNNLLNPKNPGVKELAEVLFGHSVIFLTITHGVTPEELIKFFKRIAEPAEVVKQKGRLDDFINKENIIHIKVKLLELKEIPITEEEEIKVSKIPRAEVIKENFWTFFIKGLVSKYSSIIDKLSSIEKASGLSPFELAKIINDAFEIKSAVEPNFWGFMNLYFETIKKASAGVKIDKGVKKKLEEFILSLSKEKRNIFVTKNLEFSNRASPEEAELIRNLYDKIFIEVLKYAIEGKEDLPESMLKILESSSIIKVPKETLEKYNDTIRKRRVESVLKDFYRADDIVIYKPEEYKKVLRDFLKKMKGLAIEKPSIIDLEEYQQSILEEKLQSEVILTLLELIDTEKEIERYKNLLYEIKNYFNIFLITGRFKEVNLILKILTEHEKKIQRNKKKLEILSGVLSELKSTDILTQLVKELRTVWGEEKYEEIKDIVIQYGKKGVHILVEMLSEEEDKFTRSQLVDIIAEFGEQAIDVIEEKLNDPRWYVVRNMILILRKMENKSLLHKIESLCNHSNSRVRIEALKTLLYFNSPQGISYLKKFLNDEDEFIYFSSLSLAGAFKIADVVEILIEKLKKLKINKKDYEYKAKIVQILGQIGHPDAIPQLEREIKKFRLSNWKRGKAFKRLIYNTLENYPYSAIEELIKKGLKSFDKKVKLTSTKLYRE